MRVLIINKYDKYKQILFSFFEHKVATIISKSILHAHMFALFYQVFRVKM